ncbi:sensor histidine kinase [Listeria sp. FSL L7-1485]|uniref:Sensor histidine kinase n=1 Tax=Listeria immobilis TaxID=2713502 RepID=A0A7X1C7U2_9LIST|nr:sensor histidine kinase [Listeria immobilis]MBC1481914.1 sensor histidine kinase [Listeria immobilis]MBC1487594.1 sensor histidine kinase [Listeria immobilis]MBC1507289.1 sensor histidine kinase [Listeria immobilis]MBC1510645.1 sensor histidine kinase [Listeria immobilis]MBC1515322.1 sensor histidine kinase [Listeria immobilis]
MFSILMAFIQIAGIFIAIQILTNKVFSMKEGLVTVAIAMLAFPLFTLVQYWSMIFVALIFVSALYWKNKNIVSSASITLIVIILLTISDSIVGFVLVPGLNFKYEDIFNELLPTLIYCVGMLANLLVLSYILRKLIGKINITRFAEHRKYAYIILAIVALTVLAFYMNIYAGSIAGYDSTILKTNTLIFTGYTILLIVIVAVVIKTATNELKVQNQKEQLEQLQDYVSTLESLHREMRVFRHDYVNILSTLVGYIDNNDMQGLKFYFENNIVPINKTIESNNYKISLLQNIHVMELKGLLAVKLIRAQELKIDAILEVVEPINKIAMDSIDLCKAVGILLDNAVEAALTCENPVIRIAFVKKDESMLIVFANSLPNNMPPIYKIFEEGFSTKGEGRGLGLASLREIMQKYSHVTLDTRVTNREVIQELEIM